MTSHIRRLRKLLQTVDNDTKDSKGQTGVGSYLSKCSLVQTELENSKLQSTRIDHDETMIWFRYADSYKI